MLRRNPPFLIHDHGEKVCAEILALIENHDEWSQLVQSLNRSGHNVHVLEKFSDAIEVLKEGSAIDLIISDVHLQNGGGVFDFLRWVKLDSERAKTPFVLLSMEPTEMAKYLEDGIRISARMLGASLYIRQDKFDSDTLREQIERFLPSEEIGVNSASLEIGEKR